MRRLLRARTWQLRGSAAETVMVLAVATLVVPLLIFAGASWLAYDDAHKQADERIARTLDLLYVNVRTSFETDYLVAANVAELLEDQSTEAIRANERQIHDRLKRLVESLPQIEDVWVLDREGRPLVVAKLYPAPADRSFAARNYFIAHRDNRVQRHVSEALQGPVKNVPFFQYSERRLAPDGAFDGVIAVSVSPNYFHDQFAQASDSPNFTAAIVRADGEILVRYPAGTGPSRLGPDTGFMKAVADQPDVGRYATDRSGFDGQSRVFMYRRLPDLAVYVVHGYATAAIRDAWMSRMASHLIFGLPATLALFGLAVIASRRAMQQTDTLARLSEEQARREVAEHSLRQSQKLNSIGQLTAGIAHDFNNLLTGIGGSLEMMGRRVTSPSDDFLRFLDLAKTGVSRAANLTQRLLAFSRQQPLQVEAVDANKLVSGMSELLRRTLGEQIKIETVLAGGLWRCQSDIVQLESAILNLAINGRDAMPEGGTLTIETANAHLDDAYAAANVEVKAGQYVLIAVSDTGEGMDQELMAKAFDPFFTTKQRGQGTGLGLSMTFGYVKQVGGHLKLYSEVGHGTVVKIYLPRSGAAPVDAKERPAPAVRSLGDGPVVLVVEDDPVVREFAGSACREIGCTVHLAGDGREALAVLRAHDDIALLFTDVGLPGDMNGRQLAAAACELRPTLKVLYTTGYTANAIVHHGVLDAGVNFIGKPFSIDALAAKVKSLGL
ncbi:ATP-binding protein [Reyranella sp.]|uniref:ATP-binding protein n=1 Tax=Reyranella sp. TaxID=1929291 RepID=UPI0037834D27